jgi:hypothetical protein
MENDKDVAGITSPSSGDNRGQGTGNQKKAVPIQFFDSSFEMPKAREDVKFNDIGFFVYEDKRRVAIGFNITRFLEGPSIEVTITNDNGETAGSLTVIETADTNFSLTVHLRDEQPTALYHVQATLYYATPETERVDVYTYTGTFDVSQPGEQIKKQD